MYRRLFTGIAATLFLASAGAQSPEDQLALPEGDFDQGREAFVALGCHQCHTVPGVMLPVWDGNSPVTLSLGANTLSVKTYPQLVTSIVNPNHVVSTRYLSKLGLEEGTEVSTLMPSRDDMTVRQLLDIITFLDASYEQGLDDYEAYRNYFDLLP